MDGRAIAAAALGDVGLGRLTTDIGRTRLAELARPRGEARLARAEDEEMAAVRRSDSARATRP